MVPISVISFTLFIIALAPSMNIDNVKPILGLGPYNIFVKGAVRIGDFAELIFLFLLPPFIKNGIFLTGWDSSALQFAQ